MPRHRDHCRHARDRSQPGTGRPCVPSRDRSRRGCQGPTGIRAHSDRRHLAAYIAVRAIGERARATSPNPRPHGRPYPEGEGDGTVPRVSAVPIEHSDAWLNTFVSERHASIQNHAGFLQDTGIVLFHSKVRTGHIRGSVATARTPALSLRVEDVYRARDPSRAVGDGEEYRSRRGKARANEDHERNDQCCRARQPLRYGRWGIDCTLRTVATGHVPGGRHRGDRCPRGDRSRSRRVRAWPRPDASGR